MARNSAVLWCMVAAAMASCADGRSCVGPGVKRRPLRIISLFLYLDFLSWGAQIYLVKVRGMGRVGLRAVPQQHHAGGWIVRVLYNQQSVTIGWILGSRRHPLYLCQSTLGNPGQNIGLRKDGVISDCSFGHHAHAFSAGGIHQKICGVNGSAAPAKITHNMAGGIQPVLA